MKPISLAAFEARVTKLVKGSRVVVLCVGNSARADDGAAQLLFRELQGVVHKLRIVDCGISPQDYISDVAELHPSLVIFVNAIDRSLKPGSFVLEEFQSSEATGSSKITHKFPLAWVASLIAVMATPTESTIRTILVGIQVGSTRGNITPPVEKSVGKLREVFERLDCIAQPVTPE